MQRRNISMRDDRETERELRRWIHIFVHLVQRDFGVDYQQENKTSVVSNYCWHFLKLTKVNNVY